jgi:hypothetical protein
MVAAWFGQSQSYIKRPSVAQAVRALYMLAGVGTQNDPMEPTICQTASRASVCVVMG